MFLERSFLSPSRQAQEVYFDVFNEAPPSSLPLSFSPSPTLSRILPLPLTLTLNLAATLMSALSLGLVYSLDPSSLGSVLPVVSVHLLACVRLSLSLSLSLFLSLSLSLSACLPACLPACLLTCLPACLLACLPACLLACLPACLSVCLSVCLYVCMSVRQVWDRFGRQMYQSGGLGYTITGVKWCPNGESFAVGAFNTLRLCDKTGWSHSRDRFVFVSVDQGRSA